MDEPLRQTDRQDADRDERDPEQRVDGAEVRAPRTGGHREAQHEVRAVEEEEDEEENELVLVPLPPVAPAVPRPDRAGDERERAEDHTLVNGDVALEVGALSRFQRTAQRLPAAPAEAGVRRESDRDVEVEDLLVQAVLVHGRVEEDERDRSRDQRSGRATRAPADGYSVTTYSKEAQQMIAKSAS